MASVTQKAIKPLGISDLTAKAIEEVMVKGEEKRQEKFRRCDDAYYQTAEPIADRLFAFIKANRAEIKLKEL